MSELYKRIESLCQNYKVSITEMCRESGASRASITELKMGRTQELSTATLTKIASYFDVSVDYLLGKTNQKKPFINEDEELTEYLEELKNRSEMRMLFKLAKGATKADVEQAVKIIEALRKE